MENKLADDRRLQFSERLLGALRNAGLSSRPQDVTRAYNARADGASVSVYAVRKWLTGEAIPTHEKIVVLAVWLGVSAAWLRFGEADKDAPFGQEAVISEAAISSPALQLLNDILSLPDPAQKTIRMIVDAFLKNYVDADKH